MFKKILLTFCMLEFMVACGEDDKYTWGDMSREFSDAYCDAAYQCYADAVEGYKIDEKDVAICSEHNYDHFCKYDKSCNRKIKEAEEAQTALDVCLDDLANLNEGQCGVLLFFGITPQSCGVALSSYKTEAKD